MSFYGKWDEVCTIMPISYVCSYCGENVSSEKGYFTTGALYSSYIHICHKCNAPTFFDVNGNQYPGPIYGSNVNHIENESVLNLYNEARSCISCKAYTASVLCSRKLLMNIAVSKGAEEGKNFISYIEYLSSFGYIPPDGKDWVDHIRKKGNQANHEITIMNRNDSEELLDFIEMLLKFIYEFPAVIKSKKPKP